MMSSCHCGRSQPSRRFVVAALACSAVMLPATMAAVAAPSAANDERFMRLALEQARRADFPFGAVIVRDGWLLARGRNLGRTNGDPTAHGEMVAIRRSLAAHGSRSLRGCTLYTTGEPARCAWARSCGATSGGWCSRPRCSSFRPNSIRS
jgi:tRNA(adenine34) deaminase